MGSIPLPALDIKTPQQPDFLEKYGQLMQLKNAQQQSQMQQQEAPLRIQALQQQAQSGQIGLQQQQQQLKNQQALTQAYQTWDGKSYNDLAHLALKNGATGEAVQSIQQHGLTIQKTASDIAEQDAKAGSDNATTLGKQLDMAAGALNGVLTASPEQMPQLLVSTAQQLASQKRPDGTPLLDAQHLQMAQQLAQQGPQAITAAVPTFAKSLTAFSAQLDAAQKQAATAASQATTAKTTAETDYYAKNGGAPGVPSETVERNDWLAKNLGKTASDYVAAKAGAEASARMPYEVALAQQRQALSQGDPNAAAQLLVNGDATLSELKARGATPDFIGKTLTAAHQLSGGQYNAQSADAQFQVAKSPANVAFFGSAKSLIDKGGTLDQLTAAGKQIPGGLIPAFNSIADWEKAAAGSGPIAKYAAIALGASDDFAKVMGSGTGSDASRLQALKVFGANQSPEQRAGSIQGVRGAVGSQMTSRIGNNPVLGRMYSSEPSQAPTQGGGTTAAPANDPFSQFGGKAH